MLHHAPFSSGNSHGSNPRVQWPFQTWGADVVLVSARDFETIDPKLMCVQHNPLLPVLTVWTGNGGRLSTVLLT
jgi:hypothetical protein